MREADIIDLDDIRMGQHGDRLALILKAAQKLLIVTEFLSQHLNRHRLAVGDVCGLIDIGHPADPDQLIDKVAALYFFADVVVHVTSPCLRSGRAPP